MNKDLLEQKNKQTKAKKQLEDKYIDVVEDLHRFAMDEKKPEIIKKIQAAGGSVPGHITVKQKMSKSRIAEIVAQGYPKFEIFKEDYSLQAKVGKKQESGAKLEEEEKEEGIQDFGDQLTIATENTKAVSDAGTRKKLAATQAKDQLQEKLRQEDLSMIQRAVEGAVTPQFSKINNLLSQIVLPALQTQAGQNFLKLPAVRQKAPELTSSILTNQKKYFSEDDEKKILEVTQAVHKSQDPSAKARLQLFVEEIIKKFQKKQTDEQYNSQTSGIPKIQQTYAQPVANNRSANSTIAVNGSGFAGQKVQPQPEEIYNAVTGEIRVTQYKDQKDKYLKETYHKIRNLHPEVKQSAEKILAKLSDTYVSKVAESHPEYEDAKQEYEDANFPVQYYKNKISQFSAADKNSKKYRTAQQNLRAAEQNLQKYSQKIKDIYDEVVQKARLEPELENPHVAAKERKQVQFPEFQISQAKKKKLEELGRQELEEIKVQNKPMEENLERGSSAYASAHSQNQNSQRDPGEVYNTSIQPTYHDIYPYLTDIVKVLEKEQQSDSQQSQLDLAVLDEKDPFKLLQAIEFLNSQYARVPLTTKEQQRIRNESEAISRRVGREQVFYPYNQREIRLLQGGLSKYYDANGGVVYQPALRKQYYETIQKSELQGVRKDLEYLHGIKESDKIENLKKAQLQALGEEQYKSLFPKFLTKKQRNSNKSKINPAEDHDDELGEISINDIVKAVHQLVNYTSKINGNIDLSDTNLEKYAQKTTVFTPALAKKENNTFSFTAASAFKLRPC